MERKHYDIVVLGAGIAGSTTALCLGAQNLSVLVVERKEHPRWAVGESTVPQTTHDFRCLARDNNIPELANVSSYLGMKKANLRTYPKEAFWFGYHMPGEKLQLKNEFVGLTPLPPLGPDSHMLRADLDDYLVSLLPKYGVSYLDNTNPKEVDITPEGVRLTLECRESNDESATVTLRQCTARFVVDATGHNCYLGRKFNLHHHEPQLIHRSRTIYSHFETPPGWSLEKLLEQNPYMHSTRDGGTIHHAFEGGWFWVIPFEDGTVSVGVVLDLDLYPPDWSKTAEQEWNEIIERYPTIKKHFEGLVRKRVFLRTGRIQLSSSTILGDRFILTPHAACFVDPLFSSGMSLSARFALRFVPVAKQMMAMAEGPDVAAQWRSMLQPLEDRFFKETALVDKLVNGAFNASHHLAVYRQFLRLWVLASVQTFNFARRFEPDYVSVYSSYDETNVELIDRAWEITRNFATNMRAPHAVSDEYIMSVASQVKELADQRTRWLNDQFFFDVLPCADVDPDRPIVLPGGAASNYHIAFLTGDGFRPFLFVMMVVTVMSFYLRYAVAKLFRHKRAADLDGALKFYQKAPKATTVTPFEMVKLAVQRLRNGNQQPTPQ